MISGMNNLNYTLVPTRQFEKQLSRLDRQVAKRIMSRLYGLTELDDPQARCKPMTGPLVGLWRLRTGNYRAILDIQQDKLVIVALDVDHRSRIYDH